MDEATTGKRVRKLEGEITQLRARAAEIADTIATTPQGPDPATITHRAGYLTDIIGSGTPAEQKTAIETLIAEIRITPEGIIPVFKIPQPGTPIPGNSPDTTSADTVRAPVHSVDRQGIEPPPSTGGSVPVMRRSDQAIAALESLSVMSIIV